MYCNLRLPHVTRDKYLDGYPEIKKLSFKSGFPSRQTKSSRFGNCSNGKKNKLTTQTDSLNKNTLLFAFKF